MNTELLKQRLLTIRDMVDECLANVGNSSDNSLAASSSRKAEANSVEDIAVVIANKAGDCEEAPKLKKLLDKPSPEIKILLCFYISYKYFDNHWLTTGHIAVATSELGIKIDQGQASNKIKELRRYVESGSSRKKGQPTPYRLNRLGLNRFEELMNG
ncbi:MAG TPA: hypothetical protein VGT99_14035 [Gammaproteobacteria bacterium]|nr:hypothetical protein [Gammaproteobacteria bacterium]